MNNIQQFLEEEFKDYGVRMSEDEDHFEFESPSPSKILDFTNKVLDEVKREVENCLLKQYAGRATNNKNATVWIERDVFKNDISTIIDQLKLK